MKLDDNIGSCWHGGYKELLSHIISLKTIMCLNMSLIVLCIIHTRTGFNLGPGDNTSYYCIFMLLEYIYVALHSYVCTTVLINKLTSVCWVVVDTWWYIRMLHIWRILVNTPWYMISQCYTSVCVCVCVEGVIYDASSIQETIRSYDLFV